MVVYFGQINLKFEIDITQLIVDTNEYLQYLAYDINVVESNRDGVGG
jgi:hypothetical protein